MNLRVRTVLAAILVAALAATAPASATAKVHKRAKTRPILTVGNNWDGTADLVDPTRFKRLARINIVPDLQERLA